MHGNKRTTSSEFVYLYTLVVNLMWCLLKQKKRRGFVCQMVTFMLSESVLSFFFLSYPSDVRRLYWAPTIPDSGRVPIKLSQRRRFLGDSNWRANPIEPPKGFSWRQLNQYLVGELVLSLNCHFCFTCFLLLSNIMYALVKITLISLC